jgi:hypothetical protein
MVLYSPRDARCVYHHADFFGLARGDGFDPDAGTETRFDAILLDIDHTPESWLHSSHADFYSVDGMDRLKSFLKPRGIFALWSNDPPEDELFSSGCPPFLPVPRAIVSTLTIRCSKPCPPMVSTWRAADNLLK